IVSQLHELGIEATAYWDEEDELELLYTDGSEVTIKYSLNDEDNFDQVIALINPLISKTAHYRKLRSSEGSDTWSYSILKNEDWRQLGQSVAGAVGLIFTDVRPASL